MAKKLEEKQTTETPLVESAADPVVCEWEVSLPGCPARVVKAVDAPGAVRAYNAVQNITATIHQHRVSRFAPQAG